MYQFGNLYPFTLGRAGARRRDRQLVHRPKGRKPSGRRAQDRVLQTVQRGADLHQHQPDRRRRREHLPQLEKIQEVLPSRRDEAHFR